LEGNSELQEVPAEIGLTSAKPARQYFLLVLYTLAQFDQYIHNQHKPAVLPILLHIDELNR
jgi:hypothetical protein